MSDISGQGDLGGLKEKLSGQRERYTNNETDVISRNIVNLADDHRPSAIVMEDLTGYRETADDPIHDWPTHKIREKIAYKAEDLGIPVVEIDPAYTSQTCSSCGYTDGESRDGRRFVCTDCGYDVDADFNAAVNIANKYRKA